MAKNSLKKALNACFEGQKAPFNFIYLSAPIELKDKAIESALDLVK